MADDRTQLMGARALVPGYDILWYEIEGVLGQGGFGITYLAKDKNLDRKVAIKEYLPTSFAYRHQDFSVKPITSDHGDNFAWGLSSFLTEAQTLARFSHKNIVRVQSVFEQNNTAYMVMDYEEGASLSSIYNGQEQLDQAFFENVFFPIFEGLQEIHELGFIHRDIKPANIYIRDNNTPVLIDFGSARQTSQQQTGEMTSLVSQGYTPLEQYSPNYGEQGPWTDIYALAATLYQGVSGKKPAESLSRSACLLRAKPDLVEPLLHANYPLFTQVFLNAIHSGLALQPEERPADLYTWGSLFNQNQVSHVEDFNSENTYVDTDTRMMPSSDGFANTGGVNSPITTQSLSSVGTDSWPTDMPGQGTHANVNSGSLRNDQPESDDFFKLDVQPGDDLHRPASQKIDKSKQVPKQKRSKMVPVIASASLLIGVAVLVYAFSMGYFTSRSVNVAQLPRPSIPIETTLPEQHVMARLSELDRLAIYYAQAYAIDQNNEQINLGIQSLYGEIEKLAIEWNPTRFSNIAESIRRVINRLPNNSNNKANINALLSAPGQHANSSAILSLIESNQIVRPEGSSVIDVISSVNRTEYDILAQAPQWQDLISRMVNAAVVHIEKSEFDSGARVVEAGLAIHPEDATMLELREHLALRLSR